MLERSVDPQSLREFVHLCGRSDRTKFRNQVIRPLPEASLLAMTIPSKPTSSRQQYRTTEAGKRFLSE
ncbi:Fic family protein [Planctomycetota bacterium]